MAKSKKDSRQMQFDFTFEKKLDRYIEATSQIQGAIAAGPKRPHRIECEFEACIEIAAAIKRAIRASGKSRDQVVDAVNAYFGRTEAGAQADPPTCRRPLTIHMFNNYLSKPADYPIPAYYLYAIHRVTRSLEPASTLVAPEGARVATGEELRQLNLGKLEENIAEMRRLKKELKK